MAFASIAATDLLTVNEAAKRLQLSTKTVRRLINRKELPHHRIGRAVRISHDDLMRFIAAHRH